MQIMTNFNKIQLNSWEPIPKTHQRFKKHILVLYRQKLHLTPRGDNNEIQKVSLKPSHDEALNYFDPKYP